MPRSIQAENQVFVNEAARALIKHNLNNVRAVATVSDAARAILKAYKPETIVAQYDRNFGCSDASSDSLEASLEHPGALSNLPHDEE